jgi:hypothetical protein
VDAWRDAIEAAPRDPAAAAEAGLQAALLEPGVAECELSNWVKHLVLARQRR